MHALLEMVPGLGQLLSYDWELLGRAVPGPDFSRDSFNNAAVQALQLR